MFVRIRGRSMAPTLLPGDFVTVSKDVSNLRRGEIVLLRLPPPRAGLLVKRIVGLPKERVEVRGIDVSIDGDRLDEPYVDSRAAAQPTPDVSWKLGANEFVALGDARDDSLDSRRLGIFKRRQIEGIVRRRVWPVSRWYLFRHE